MLRLAPCRAATRVVAQPARRVCTRATKLSPAQLEQVVHKYFDSLNSEKHDVESFVSPGIKLFDNTNQACYHGFAAIKHRMQSVHESLPVVREVSDVVDTSHNCVAAHFVAKNKQGQEISGSFTFKFDDQGLISEVIAYQDSDEEEFLEA